ncbi:hypothetical protein BY458DRAFT_517170 [Sporodiniella umbellata]|nr:hypothetical protein BY458DRAFT_517170 [Sporodiniella umbellata]
MKSSKKVTEYHFIDVNDPERYKKIKVSRACDLCRKRKSKCDLGIPGSGSCSNCKRTQTQCVFSSKNLRRGSIQQFSSQYQEQRPHFSVDSQGLCTFEKDISHYSPMHSTAVASGSLMHSPPLEVELFSTYFAFIHPFYPVLDSYKTLESLKTNPDTLPLTLKYSIMALALQFHVPSAADNRELSAAAYYQYAYSRLDLTPSLANIQTLLLMYKYEEMITPVGVPFSVSAIEHLKEAKVMLDHLEAETDASWTLHNEFVCRAAWIWYINLSFSNLADPRCKDMLSLALPPTRLPSLTDTEHYDETSLNITCNFMHLISIAVIYSQTTCYIANNATLFSSTDHPTFIQLFSQLQVWLHSLPNQLRLPSHLPFAQQVQDDPSKTGAFAVYLGLIHDTLGLLLMLHQRPFQGSQLALDLVVKASQFTRGDLPHPHFSRFASIQGSRLIVYGLTLGFQALSFNLYQSGLREKLDPFTHMALQVLDPIAVSSQLSLAIQAIKPWPEEEEDRLSLPSRSSLSAPPPTHTDPHPDPAWQICQWDYPDAKTATRYTLSCDVQTPPAEQHVSPCIVPSEPFKEPVAPRLVAPMPFDIIDPSFELYPVKSVKHPSL